MQKRPDLEAERRADRLDVLAVQLLEDRRLAGIVEPAADTRPEVSTWQRRARRRSSPGPDAQEKDAHLLLLEAILADDGEQAHSDELSARPTEGVGSVVEGHGPRGESVGEVG
jgi:hypothetical protein